MSFLNKVDNVQFVHIRERFKLFKGDSASPLDDRVAALSCSARIFLDNALGVAVQQSVDGHRNRKTIEVGELDNIDLKDQVVYTCPVVFNFIMSNPTFSQAKHVVVSRRMQIDDRLILLRLEDLERKALVDYSFNMTPHGELKGEVEAELTLDAEFFLKSVSGTDYTCTYAE